MAGLPQTVVDLVRLGEIRVVDEALLADGSARLFAVHAHHNAQLVPILLDGRLQQGRVFARGFSVMDRTWADDDKQTVVVAAQDVRNLLARLKDGRRSPLSGRKFLLQKDRRQYYFDPFNAQVVSGIEHGRCAASLNSQRSACNYFNCLVLSDGSSPDRIGRQEIWLPPRDSNLSRFAGVRARRRNPEPSLAKARDLSLLSRRRKEWLPPRDSNPDMLIQSIPIHLLLATI